MGIGNILLIIGIGLLAWFLIAPDSFNATKDSLFGHKDDVVETKTVEKIVYVNVTEPNKTKLAAVNVTNPKPYVAPNVTNTTNTTNVTAPVVVNVCTLPFHGLPDYVGTNKEGQDCADTLINPDFFFFK